jgi:hypothetical protein
MKNREINRKCKKKANKYINFHENQTALDALATLKNAFF